VGLTQAGRSRTYLEGGQESLLALFYFVGKRRKDKSCDSDRFETESPFREPVEIPLQDSIDLHPFKPKDIPSVVEGISQTVSARRTD